MKNIKIEKLHSLNLDYIDIIWYWSIIFNYHFYNSDAKKVLVNWYKRSYRQKVLPEWYDDKWLRNHKKYFDQYDIDKQEFNFIKKYDLKALTIEKSKNSILNWILTRLYKKDFTEFILREKWYYLEEVIYSDFDFPNKKDKAYILLTNTIYEESFPFIPYHLKIREWSKKLWKDFLDIFDKSFF